MATLESSLKVQTAIKYTRYYSVQTAKTSALPIQIYIYIIYTSYIHNVKLPKKGEEKKKTTSVERIQMNHSQGQRQQPKAQLTLKTQKNSQVGATLSGKYNQNEPSTT